MTFVAASFLRTFAYSWSWARSWDWSTEQTEICIWEGETSAEPLAISHSPRDRGGSLGIPRQPGHGMGQGPDKREAWKTTTDMWPVLSLEAFAKFLNYIGKQYKTVSRKLMEIRVEFSIILWQEDRQNYILQNPLKGGEL